MSVNTNVKGVEMTDATVMSKPVDDELNSRTTLRLDEDTHFRLKWTSMALRKTMQNCLREAVLEWLDRNRESASNAAKRAQATVNASE
jgi:predicted transcriptional regulator